MICSNPQRFVEDHHILCLSEFITPCRMPETHTHAHTHTLGDQHICKAAHTEIHIPYYETKEIASFHLQKLKSSQIIQKS